MKIYLPILFFIAACLTGCAGQEKKQVNSIVETNAVDLKSKGMVDLGESGILEDILCQDWEYTEDALDAENVDPTSTLEMQYRGYCFFNDGLLVKDPRGNVKIGKWELVKEEKPISISMNFSDGEKQRELLSYFTAAKIIFAGRRGEVPPTTLSARAFRHINIKDDPFYPDNIWWMIKPASPETDEQIKKRFKACLHFFVLFYDEYVKVPAKRVSFVGLPSCYNWYVGGIILQRQNKLQQKWINCFYNEEQAWKAYKLADKLVSRKYDWPKNEGQWMKRTVGVLRQMENRLDSIN